MFGTVGPEDIDYVLLTHLHVEQTVCLERATLLRYSWKGFAACRFLAGCRKAAWILGKITKETVALEGLSVTRVTCGVGAKWSQELKGYVGTESCQLPHVALVLSGKLHVVMDDGSAEDFSKNNVMLLPPGHDAWTVGDEPCAFVEFSRGGDYFAHVA